MFKINETGNLELAPATRHGLEAGRLTVGHVAHETAVYAYENAEPPQDVDTSFKFSMAVFASETIFSKEDDMEAWVDGTVDGIRLSETLAIQEDHGEEESEEEDGSTPEHDEQATEAHTDGEEDSEEDHDEELEQMPDKADLAAERFRNESSNEPDYSQGPGGPGTDILEDGRLGTRDDNLGGSW